jgi:two-component system cell cycle sensor histidine kinase/response regulator CckA
LNRVDDLERELLLLRQENVALRDRAARVERELDEVRRSEARFRALVEHSEEAISLTSRDGKTLYRGPATARMLGWSPEELKQRSWTDNIHPEDLPGLLGIATRVARGEVQSAKLSLRAVRRDGSVRWLEGSCTNRLDDPQVGAVVSAFRDVTEARNAACEREQLVATLEFERRRMDGLFEKVPAFIAVLRGPDHVFERVNDAYYAVVGHRDLLGRSCLEAVPEAREQGFEQLLDRVLATGETFAAESMPMLLRRGGNTPELRYLDFSYQALTEADGTRSGIFVHGVDVTDAVLSQRRIRAQFNGVPVPTYVWQRAEIDGRPDFALLDFNTAAIETSKGAIEGHLGDLASRYFADTPEMIADLERCSRDGTTIQREMDWKIHPTGDVRRVVVTYAAAPSDLVVVHTEDVTERARLELQLRQAQKMEAVGQLAGGVAHDFNNLMSVILSYGQLALESVAPGDAAHAHIGEIQRAGTRAAELTRQLLAFSRRQVLQPRVIDLFEVASSMTAMLGRLLGETVELVLQDRQGAGHVLADRGQIEQVLMNLAMNARDAMPDGGRLEIAVANAEDADASATGGAPGSSYVVLSVRDTGVGMDAATTSRIFEPFFTTKEPGKGTGLGLSTVFGIVQQSGGHVSVVSTPERGTTFRVFLPRTEATTVVKVPLERSLSAGDETVLVVEDEAQLRAVVARVLRRSGYRVLEASNAGEALMVAEAHAEEIHLLLTDVVMPHMSGSKLVERLTPLRPEIKIVYMSGHASDALGHHGVLDAQVAFLQKPFAPDAMLRKIREVLDADRDSRDATA